MSDLIRRSDAIEALGECPYNWTDTEAEVQEVRDWEYHKVAIEAVDAIDAVSVEWIPCEERLPNSDDYTCLVNVIADGITYPIILAPYYEVEEMYKRGCVNAWMPLPKPYERSDT